MEDNFKDDSNNNNDAFKDYRYNDENQFNPDPDAAVPTQPQEQEISIEAVQVECLNCSIKDIQKYDTPITKIQVLRRLHK